MIGLQPILLGAIFDAHQLTEDELGVVAMGEIMTLGLGVALGDALLPGARLRSITIVAAALTAGFDTFTLDADGLAELLAIRAAAGLAQGVLVWGTTGVIVRSANPERLGGIFFVVQTLAQAAVGFALANLVLPAAGWRGGFAVLAGTTVLVVALAFAQPAQLAPLPPPVATGFRWSPRAVASLVVVFLQLAAVGAFWAYSEPLGKAAGFDAPAAQTLISGVLVVQVLGGSLASVLVRRLSVVSTLVMCSVVLAATTLAVHQLPHGQSLPFAIACVPFGFVWLFMLPFQIGLAFRADPSGRVASLVPAAQLLGSAFGPLFASFTTHGKDVAAVPLVSASFAIAAGILLVVTRPRGAAQRA
jgi:predicted MFS family arabinose efflux permease